MCPCRKTKKDRMIARANNIAQTNIDIVEIIKKLKEVDKLKELLLTKE